MLLKPGDVGGAGHMERIKVNDDNRFQGGTFIY
jgi:hypothetical protein